MTLPEMNQILDLFLAHPRDDEGGRYAFITALLGAMLILPSGGAMVLGVGSFQSVLVEENGACHIVMFDFEEASATAHALRPSERLRDDAARRRLRTGMLPVLCALVAIAPLISGCAAAPKTTFTNGCDFPI